MTIEPTAVRDVAMLIDGRWTAAASGETFEATSPSTGRIIGSVPKGGRDDARRAVAAAAAAQPAWAARSPFDRAAILERVARILESRADELANALTLDQGKPLQAEAYGEVEELIVYFRMASADTTRLDGIMPPSVDPKKRVLVYRVPLGVVGVITPWNWPYTMPAEIIAPALGGGNTVVWSPASSTSVCSAVLASCIAEADLPPGVFNLVTGPGSEVGDELAGHPDVAALGFVGSSGTGRRIQERAIGKELLLEMGGNGPLVILDDADLDAAVAATLTACFLNAGQSCTAGEWILVDGRVHDAYVERLTSALRRETRLGDPFDPLTTMGPLNNERTAAKTERHVAQALATGAAVVAGGTRSPELGSPLFFQPTVITGVRSQMEIAREETFGPVAPITRIAGIDEAIAIVNASAFGLLNAIFTRDLRVGLRFAESVRAGWVNINEGTNYWESHLPFGGRAGSLSGHGRVGGRFLIERLTELKTVVVNLA
ncbi:MAG TPA: aldehyde dehydrogenase family protein [Candidatus Limnocylindrales bacterium]|nr:aldehyde dehydrogenase family protein [Candidatus Limnocylindrales bacterium]